MFKMQVFWNLSRKKAVVSTCSGTYNIYLTLSVHVKPIHFLETAVPNIYKFDGFLLSSFHPYTIGNFLHFFEFAFFGLNLKECPRWAHVCPAIFWKVFRDVDPFFPYSSLHAMVTNNNNVGLVSDAMILQLLYEFTQKFVNFFHLIIHLPRDKCACNGSCTRTVSRGNRGGCKRMSSKIS